MPIWPGFIGGSGVSQSLIGDAEDTINLYVEKLPGAKDDAGPAALLPTPGFTRLAQVGDVGSRAALYLPASMRFFMVIGGGFYEFDANWTASKRGTVALDANPAQIIFNGVLGNQLGVASGGNFYYYNLTTNVLTQVLTGEATQVAFAAGYGLALNLLTGKVRLSNLNDLSIWNAGTFYQRSLFADPYQSMFVDANNLVWMVGTDTFEVRYNSGVGTQPFVPLSGLVGAYGIVAPFAWTTTGLGNFWIARNPNGVGQLVVTQGGTPTVISSYPFNTAVAAYQRTAGITDAELLAHQVEGHTFIVSAFPAVQVTTPTSPTTWACDAETHSFAKRGRWNADKARWETWAPRVHAFAFNTHVVGDRATGIVSQMDTALTTEVDGAGIVRERTAPAITDEHRRTPIDVLELRMDVGLGTVSGQGSDPTATLRVSIDGGRTFGDERRAGVGKIGEYGKRVYWTRLGAPSSLIARVRFSDKAPTRIVQAFINNFEGSTSAGRAA